MKEIVDELIENIENLSNEQITKLSLELQGESNRRKEYANERKLESSIGDISHRNNICNDIIHNGNEFQSKEGSWYYGALTIERKKSEKRPDYITMVDFDGVSCGIISINKILSKDDPTSWLRNELDERELEVYEKL